MPTEAQRKPCPVPIRKPGTEAEFQRCGLPAVYLVAWADRDEAQNLCLKHGERFKEPPYSDMPSVTVTRY